MKFYPNRGQSTASRIPAGDSRLRDVCDHCNTAHYVDPRSVVDTVPAWNDQVLLRRRTIEPRYGSWTLPTGFMEIGEMTVQAADRETVEETGANVRIGELYLVLNVPHVHQVYPFYLAKLNDLDFAPGEENLEVTLFNGADIPWNDFAFLTVIYTLRCFLADRAADKLANDSFRLHTLDIYKPMRSAVIDMPITTP